jgi:hypothetical protein
MQRIIRVTYTVGWEMWRSRDWEAAAEEFFLDLGMALRRRRFLDVVTITPEVRATIIKKSRAATMTKRRMSMADSRGRASTQPASAPPVVRAVSRLNRGSTASASALATNRGPYTSSPYSISSSSGSPRALSESSDSFEFNPFSGACPPPSPRASSLTAPPNTSPCGRRAEALEDISLADDH